MKRIIFILLFFPLLAFAGRILYSSDSVSQQSSFPGGERELYYYINNYISYEACYATPNGEFPAIEVSIIIDSVGGVHNVRCIHSMGTLFESKVIDALQHMPIWNPARIGGRKVNSTVILSIKYTIPGTKVYAKEHGNLSSGNSLNNDSISNNDFDLEFKPTQYDINQNPRTNLFVLIIGFIQMLFSFSLALLPAALIIMLILYMKKQRVINYKEVVKYFIFGIISIIPALAIEKIFDFENFSTWKGIIIYSFIVVGLAEESGKFLFLRVIAYEEKNFKGPYDGIVYAVLISMGFATAENLFYTYFGGSSIALIRMFTAVPAHAAFAVLMGFFAGLAKVRKFPAFYLTIGLLTAVFFHGLYDFFLLQDEHPQLKTLTLFFLIVSIYLSVLAIKIGRRYKTTNLETEIDPYDSEYTKDGL